MCLRNWAIRNLLVTTLVLCATSQVAAQWSPYSDTPNTGRSSSSEQIHAWRPNYQFQSIGNNPIYMKHFVGRQVRHNAYQEARLRGMQIRLQQEMLRATLRRVKSQHKFEQRYASLKLPGSSRPGAKPTQLPSDNGSEPSHNAPDSNLGLTQQDVNALREHYAALTGIHALRRDQLIARNPQRQAQRCLPSQFDRASGRVSWPALLLDHPGFREHVVHLNKLLANWAQHGHDPTSLAALQARQTMEQISRQLLVMRGMGLIDEVAWTSTREFLASAAYETECSDGDESGVTDGLAAAR